MCLRLDTELTRRSKPVHGLIFLFQYVSDDWEVDEESDTDEVWFANQVSAFQQAGRSVRTNHHTLRPSIMHAQPSP